MDVLFIDTTVLRKELCQHLGEAFDEELDEFDLDVRVIEAGESVGALLRSTDDNCGSSCSGTACVTNVAHPS
jgi:FxLD family lantipeptide